MSERHPRPAEVKRALTHAVAEAGLVLKSGELSDEQIHTVRKTLKSARATLRVLRYAVGRAAYARENAALRDAARPLSAVRDSRSMLDSVDELRGRKGTQARRLVLTALRGRLQQAHVAARAKFEDEGCAAVSESELQRAWQRVAQWAPRRGRAPLVRALERIYRKARKALDAVEREGSAENRHELRKAVKYLRAALAPLDSVTIARDRTIKRADKLASLLGDDHDLHVLAESLASAPPARADVLTEEIEQRRAKLQKRALRRARKLLRRKPAAFAKRLAL